MQLAPNGHGLAQGDSPCYCRSANVQKLIRITKAENIFCRRHCAKPMLSAVFYSRTSSFVEMMTFNLWYSSVPRSEIEQVIAW